ncbi:hypothetical protein AAH073_23550 [Bacteroides ovatus]|jgi:hypothetical protein|uniref:hypothetical protein n=1 Tax=Bacteroides ovatus TaxID=28116 RepID=UPI0039B54933
MKDKIKNIAEKLEHQIRMHELDLNDRIKDIPQIILLLEQGWKIQCKLPPKTKRFCPLVLK